MQITFLLNGETTTVHAAPTVTLLDWLRETRRLTGTKEGCNEGDCGACTVMVTEDDGTARALNACILLLPQLHGKAVRTVEGIRGPCGTLHPVQEAMVTHHGSQCGFCTPGVVVSMAVAHLNGRRDHDDILAGNLCRCTGYAPIVRAAEAAAHAPVPAWMRADAEALPSSIILAEIPSGGLGTAERGAEGPPPPLPSRASAHSSASSFRGSKASVSSQREPSGESITATPAACRMARIRSAS